jgi:hypothetical protein
MNFGKTYDYILTLKPSKGSNAYDWVSRILLFLATAIFAYYAWFQYLYAPDIAAFGGVDNRSHNLAAAIIFFLAVLAAGLYSLLAKKAFRTGLFIAAIAWFYLYQQYILGILYIVAGLMEWQVKFKPEIGFDAAGITLNSFPKRLYKWHEVSNVILKDGIITVDLYNNRIIQKELEDEAEDMEQEFNQFCRSHLLSV